MKLCLRSSLLCGLFVFCLSIPPAHSYSVLAHQAVIDAAWDDAIVPLLRKHYVRPAISSMPTRRRAM